MIPVDGNRTMMGTVPMYGLIPILQVRTVDSMRPLYGSIGSHWDIIHIHHMVLTLSIHWSISRPLLSHVEMTHGFPGRSQVVSRSRFGNWDSPKKPYNYAMSPPR